MRRRQDYVSRETKPQQQLNIVSVFGDFFAIFPAQFLRRNREHAPSTILSAERISRWLQAQETIGDHARPNLITRQCSSRNYRRGANRVTSVRQTEGGSSRPLRCKTSGRVRPTSGNQFDRVRVTIPINSKYTRCTSQRGSRGQFVLLFVGRCNRLIYFVTSWDLIKIPVDPSST